MPNILLVRDGHIVIRNGVPVVIDSAGDPADCACCGEPPIECEYCPGGLRSTMIIHAASGSAAFNGDIVCDFWGLDGIVRCEYRYTYPTPWTAPNGQSVAFAYVRIAETGGVVLGIADAGNNSLANWQATTNPGDCEAPNHLTGTFVTNAAGLTAASATLSAGP